VLYGLKEGLASCIVADSQGESMCVVETITGNKMGMMKADEACAYDYGE
jgi:hypothetical protein